jgi:hypothetical protein
LSLRLAIHLPFSKCPSSLEPTTGRPGAGFQGEAGRKLEPNEKELIGRDISDER